MALPVYFIDSKVLVTGGQGVNRLNSSFNLHRYITDVIGDTSQLGASVTLADGSVTSPSLKFDSDTNTGIYWVSADVIGFSVGGVAQLKIGSGAFTLSKEVDHTFSVTDTSTAATAGGAITITAGKAGTSGTGGATAINGGVGGTTGTGGGVSITSGAGGTTSGNSGTVSVKSANEASTDSSGAVSVSSGTTVSAVSGTMLVQTGAVSTAGNSGSVTVATGTTASGVSGLISVATGTGTTGTGAITSTTGAASGGTSGASTISTGTGTTGTGDVTIVTGNASAGNAGSVSISTGTSSSATVASSIVLSKGVVRKPLSASVASGGTITGPQLVGGLITCTGATGNWQLPTCAQITTALGATPAGTILEFYVNAAGMTATNTATLVVGSNMTVQSAPPITGGGTLTVTQDTQVMAKFIIMYDSATTCKIARIA